MLNTSNIVLSTIEQLEMGSQTVCWYIIYWNSSHKLAYHDDYNKRKSTLRALKNVILKEIRHLLKYEIENLKKDWFTDAASASKNGELTGDITGG